MCVCVCVHTYILHIIAEVGLHTILYYLCVGIWTAEVTVCYHNHGVNTHLWGRLGHREEGHWEGRELETLRDGLLATPHHYHLHMRREEREGREVRGRGGEG